MFSHSLQSSSYNYVSFFLALLLLLPSFTFTSPLFFNPPFSIYLPFSSLSSLVFCCICLPYLSFCHYIPFSSFFFTFLSVPYPLFFIYIPFLSSGSTVKMFVRHVNSRISQEGDLVLRGLYPRECLTACAKKVRYTAEIQRDTNRDVKRDTKEKDRNEIQKEKQ